ncbi:GNAT family N-acetyltransferase [Janibacter melonis]|uniref:GNAT family N-acetyltransferase n=1 Tax=Janibacter melonis TaxID=262209 RepID=UPI002094A30E|nr:GNAT family N-acetyltransferase [Janibacter melonis]
MAAHDPFARADRAAPRPRRRVVVREAALEDVPTIVAMLADDPLGQSREDPADLAPYDAAFVRIAGDPGEVLVVAELDGQVVGTLQLSVLPSLSRRVAARPARRGPRRRRHARRRGGEQLVRWALERARAEGCELVQLTSDSSRTGARRFYERLGFTASHVGMKLALR